MTHHIHDTNEIQEVVPAERPSRNRRPALIAAAIATLVVVLIVLWKMFFVYVPPGKVLVVVAKTGADLPPNQVLAHKGQKGVQEEVLGEGYHFVWPILYTTELRELTVVPPGQVGIVTALGGDKPKDGGVLAKYDNEQGIRQQVLMPGAYRLNPYGSKVDMAVRHEVRPGYVGVKRRLLGKDSSGRFALKADEKGILRDVLQPGLYYVNTKEYEIIDKCEVGVYQTTYSEKHHPKGGKGAIVCRSRDGFSLSVDCTIEWEVLPANWPELVADYGTFDNIERNVINVQVEQILPNRALNFGAEDFLDGSKREAFQNDFKNTLEKTCREKHVEVRSAFVRNISIPEEFLEQKRKLHLSLETQETNKARKETAQSVADVERQKKEIDQQVAQTKAETAAMVTEVERQTTNLKELTKAEIDKTRTEYKAKIDALDALKNRELGVADATVKELKETATNSIHKMRMDVFENNGDAYLRYAMADMINPNLRIRLYQSGPGTFWTNMDGKGFNLMVTPPATAKSPPEK
jgi:regulator of protease activity HflC (stomatin/prohibitin superfamily)